MDNKDIVLKLKHQKRLIYILIAVLAVVVSALAYIVYVNYDYILFKAIMTKGYVYDNSIKELIDSELEQTDSDIDTYFDDTVINVFISKLYEKSQDPYTHIYLPAQYTARIESEKANGSNCLWFPFNENTAYIQITNFTNESVDFVSENAADISEYNNLILDLRDNPGGYISSANKIAEMFLQSGDVISVEKSEMSFLSKTNKAKGGHLFDFDKIIILQDGNTASSSEILIGALRDNLENVVLMGDTTYGKGIGQYTVPLKNGYYFIATMFTWETPSGETINKKGIKADMEFTAENLADELGIELKE